MNRATAVTTALCLMGALLAGSALAQTPDRQIRGLLFPLRGDVDDISFETSILHTALHGASGGALLWDVQQPSVYRAMMERRITLQEAQSWDQTELSAAEADPLALRLARALGKVDVAVYGRALDGGPGSDQITYELRVIDVGLGHAKSITVTGDKQLIGRDSALAILATYREMREVTGEAGALPEGGDGASASEGASMPSGPDWVASADPNAEALYHQAVEVSMQHDLEAALALLDKADRFDPASPRIKLERAYVLQRMGSLARALEAVDAARTLAPQDPDVRALHAQLSGQVAAEEPIDVGTPDVDPLEGMSQRELEEYCKAHPGDREAIRRLARAYEYNGQFGNALRYYELLAELLVGDVEVQTKIGRMYLKLGTHDKAETAFLQILRWDPSNATAHEELGRLKSLSDRPSDRKEAFDHFVKASDRWAEGHRLESPVYLSLVALIEDELIYALDKAHTGISALDEILRGRGDAPPEFRRERIYAEVEEAGARADSSGEMLCRLEPPPTASDMHAKYLEAARLTNLACTKLMLALDTASETDLQMAHWTREQAIKAMAVAVELRGELPQPSE